MTPFIHAEKKGYNSVWNIDADDLMLLHDSNKVADALLQVEKIAEEKNYSCLTLDMFSSLSYHVHWSFGVVYIRDVKESLAKVKKCKNWLSNFDLIKKNSHTYLNYLEKFNCNIDCYFTYLRDIKELKLGVFYIENSMLVHMPDTIWQSPFRLTFWSDGKLQAPIVVNYLNESVLSDYTIDPMCFKIDIGLDKNDFKQFYRKYILKKSSSIDKDFSYFKKYSSERGTFDINTNRFVIEKIIE